MSAFSTSFVRLCKLLIPSFAASLIATSAVGQELRDITVGKNCSKTVRTSQGSPRPATGSRDGQSSAWKQASSRGWTASVPARGPRNIQLVSATDSEEQEKPGDPVVPTPSPVGSRPADGRAGSPKSSSPDSADTATRQNTDAAITDVPPLPDARPLTATERFKRALAEQRRALEEQAVRNQSPDNSINMQTPLETPKKSSGLTATIDSGLNSDDPQKRETAERFQRLKEKLAKLKLRVQNAENPQDLKPHGSGSNEDHADQSNPNTATQHSKSDHAAEHSAGHDAAAVPDKTAVDPAEQHSAAEDTHRADDSHAEPSSKHDEHSQHGDSAQSSGKHPAANDPAHSSTSDDTTQNHEGHDDGKHHSPTDAASASPNSEHSRSDETEAGTHGAGTHEAGDLSESGTQAVFSDKAVVDGPIDRIGLANNLYAVGEFRLAMEVYEPEKKVDLSPEQQIWCEYQAANCLRRLGKNGEASNRYRRLADMAEAGWLSDQSRWWLEVLEQVRLLEKSLENDADPAVNPEAALKAEAHTEAPAADAAHQTATNQNAPHAEDLHKTPPKATKEPSHGEHSE